MVRVRPTGGGGFRQVALRAVLIVGIDPGLRHKAVFGRCHFYRNPALRVLQPEPGHLDHHGEPLADLPGVHVGVLHREGGGVETLHPVDLAELLVLFFLAHF